MVGMNTINGISELCFIVFVWVLIQGCTLNKRWGGLTFMRCNCVRKHTSYGVWRHAPLGNFLHRSEVQSAFREEQQCCNT